MSHTFWPQLALLARTQGWNSRLLSSKHSTIALQAPLKCADVREESSVLVLARAGLRFWVGAVSCPCRAVTNEPVTGSSASQVCGVAVVDLVHTAVLQESFSLMTQRGHSPPCRVMPRDPAPVWCSGLFPPGAHVSRESQRAHETPAALEVSGLSPPWILCLLLIGT